MRDLPTSNRQAQAVSYFWISIAIGGAVQRRDALGPGPAAPVGTGGARGRDGAIDRAARGGKEMPSGQSRVIGEVAV
jgi:hypothetical protein